MKSEVLDIPTAVGVVKVNVRYVASSNVTWVGWPLSGQPILFVEFHDGSRYVYASVTRQRAVALANAPSVGRYLNSKIKKRKTAVQLR